MPIVQGQGQFNTGRDISIVLIGGNGARVDMPNVMSFQSAQETASVKVDRLDGIQLPAELPKGWTGSIDLDRGSAAVDDFFASGEAAWQDQGVYQNATMFTYIKEADGSTTTYQYDTVALKLTDAGQWKGDAPTPQKITFTSNRRRRV